MSDNSLHTAWRQAEADCHRLIELALAEDLGSTGDCTTNALVPPDRLGVADVVAREAGIACGVGVADVLRRAAGATFACRVEHADGEPIEAGGVIASLRGPARELLTYERTLLNFLGRLSGVATLARRYADAIDHTRARVFDTRKTTPGWRLLEKYAVRCGGGVNHRMGLHDAVMIKDNHLAFAGQQGSSLAEAIAAARAAVAEGVIVQVEVDTLDQLRHALAAGPDIVLLDNMTPAELRDAVSLRHQADPRVELEASGGVTLETIVEIAETGVDRISVGALTHSPRSLDIGLDWRQDLG